MFWYFKTFFRIDIYENDQLAMGKYSSQGQKDLPRPFPFKTLNLQLFKARVYFLSPFIGFFSLFSSF